MGVGGKAWQPKFSTGWERSPGESALFREVIESQQCCCVVSQSGDGMDYAGTAPTRREKRRPATYPSPERGVRRGGIARAPYFLLESATSSENGRCRRTPEPKAITVSLLDRFKAHWRLIAREDEGTAGVRVPDVGQTRKLMNARRPAEERTVCRRALFSYSVRWHLLLHRVFKASLSRNRARQKDPRCASRNQKKKEITKKKGCNLNLYVCLF